MLLTELEQMVELASPVHSYPLFLLHCLLQECLLPLLREDPLPFLAHSSLLRPQLVQSLIAFLLQLRHHSLQLLNHLVFLVCSILVCHLLQELLEVLLFGPQVLHHSLMVLLFVSIDCVHHLCVNVPDVIV